MDGDLVDVEIHDLAPGGDAVGREVARVGGGAGATGRTTFVPLAAPGELVRARLVREKPRVAWAELVEVLRASVVRVRPSCALFGTCGGCQWQHVERGVQLEAKANHVARALRLPSVPILAASPDWGYRDRARVHVGEDGRVGFKGRRSHALIALDEACPLWSERVRAAWAMARERIASSGTREVTLQAGRNGVVVTTAPPFAVNDGRVEAAVEVDVAEPEAPSLMIPAGAFAQVGAIGNAALVAAVLEALGPKPGRVLELYAGSGNFTRHVALRATSVTAAEGDARAVAAGRRNVPSADWTTHQELATRQAARYDVCLVDPPREGLDPLGASLVRPAPRLVYVSCDPQTLGRDAERLAAGGYALEGALALDLMPHTFHVEVVARFVRR